MRRICLALLLPLGFSSHAQIRTDGSLGVAGPQNFNGAFVNITQAHGKLVGSNLFHSFQTFNVAPNQAAYFTTTTPGLANVISRVTGGSASQIRGTLGLSSFDASPTNLFFINPAGVTFGAGAVIDVPGSFHVSTANYIKFADGNFHADLGQSSTFSSAPPEAFGFLGTSRAYIFMWGDANLSTVGAQAISLVAGDVYIEGSTVATESGAIRLAAVGQQATEVPFSGALGVLDGYMAIYNGSVVYSASSGFDQSGSVTLGAGDIDLSGGSTVATQALFFGGAGDLELSAARGLTVRDGGQIFSRTFYVGDAGSIKLQGTDITIGGQGGAPVGVASFTQPNSYGNAGNIRIEATGELAISGASRVSTTTQSSGNAGNVFASGANITIDGQYYYGPTGIFSESPLGTGHAGSIELVTPGTLTITRDGFVSTTTLAGADAGPISIQAGALSIGDDLFTTAGIISSVLTGAGKAGSIDITVTGNLSVLNNALISSTSGGSSGAGSVTVHAGSVLVDGGAVGFPVISSDTSGVGNAGRVDIVATGDVIVQSGGVISSSTYGPGDAGSVTVAAASVVVDGLARRFAGIQSDTFGEAFAATGKAGNVEVTATGDVSVVQGGHISSSTFYGGNSGSVLVQAARVLLDGRGIGGDTSISSEAVFGTGDGGRVDVEATGEVLIVYGGAISSQTRSFGNAGAVKVSAGMLTIDGGGLPTGIFNTSGFIPQAGNAGNIDVIVSGTLEVTNDGRISSSTDGTGNAGAVDISAGAGVYIFEGGMVESATQGSGHAGSIRVRADRLSIIAPVAGYLTGISTDTRNGTGSGGNIDIAVTRDVSILFGGSVSSNTSSDGNAGTVSVSAATINLDGGGPARTRISSETTGGAGNAGRVDVTASGELRISEGSLVSSGTNSQGSGGAIHVEAGSIVIDARGSDLFTGITSQAAPGSTGNAGQVDIHAIGSLTLLRGGTIDSSTFTSGNAGSVRVRAQDVLVDSTGSYTYPNGAGRAVGGIFSSASYGSSGNSGTVDVEATNQVSVLGGGAISSGTQASGLAGSVRVAARVVLVDGFESSIDAEAIAGSSGQTGDVVVSASERISVTHGGSLSVRTDASVDDPGSLTPTNLTVTAPIVTVTGGSITAATGGNVNASAVGVNASNTLSVLLGGQIGSDTSAQGHAGIVTVRAGNVLIDGHAAAGKTGISSNTSGSGIAGVVDVQATNSILLAHGGTISTDTYGSGTAGYVFLAADQLTLSGEGFNGFTGLSSAAQSGSSGDAGAVIVFARNVVVDGAGTLFDLGTTGIRSDARHFSSGNAGNILVSATETLSLLNGGVIASDVYPGSTGNAGSISIATGKLLMQGASTAASAIFSNAYETSSGNAGEISVQATGDVSISGGLIQSITWGAGKAGDIVVKGSTVRIDTGNISASAQAGSSGQTGFVKVEASNSITLDPGGFLSISNDATVADPGLLVPTKLIVSAPDITLKDASITAASSGNVNASNIEVNIEVNTTGALAVFGGGVITSETLGAGDAGVVRVQAGSILIDVLDSSAFTGISSQAQAGSFGNAGVINVVTSRDMSVRGSGGQVTSSTLSSGNAGSVTVQVGGSLSLSGGGQISSDTLSLGNAGKVSVDAAGQLSIAGGGKVSSSTSGAGSAGSVLVKSGNLLVDGANSSIAAAASNSSFGQTGSVTVTAAEGITVSNGGSLSVRNEAGVADPGAILPTTLSVTAPRITVSGGSITAASSGNVNASNIEVNTTGALAIRNTGIITSDTSGAGNAGMVQVRAGSIEIEALADNVFNGISSQAQDFSTGNAGTVSVMASGDIALKNKGAQITSSTFSSGNAGSVAVEAGGTFSLLGGQVSSDTLSSGNAGTVTAVAANIVIDGGVQGGAGIFSDTFGSGHAGHVSVRTPGHLSITGRGQISSSAHIAGDAGPVQVIAASIAIDGQGAIGSGIFSESRGPAGNAGDVTVHAGGALSLVNAGQISSSSVRSGNAGKVTVTAGSSIAIDAQGNNGLFTTAGIFSDTQGDGNAGQVSVDAVAQLSIAGGGKISSSTSGAGIAGSVLVNSGTLVVDGANSSIAASAADGSSGQTGNVTVTAGSSILLSNGGNLSIRNDATVLDPAAIVPTVLSVSAPDITLKDASITAASTGNVAASDIEISFTNHLFIDPSSITTSANLGNGGSIMIGGGQFITLENSQITTSVLGLTGNGGDISISADTLFLLTGFIQANTGAANASGGLVNINVQFLLASGNSLFTGGNVPFVFQPGVFGFNVIQAAAPTGLSGLVQLTTPPLDVSGSLVGLSTQALDIGGLARNPCQVTGGSSLAQAGRGGLPPSARGLLRYEPEPTQTAQNPADVVLARSLVSGATCL